MATYGILGTQTSPFCPNQVHQVVCKPPRIHGTEKSSIGHKMLPRSASARTSTQSIRRYGAPRRHGIFTLAKVQDSSLGLDKANEKPQKYWMKYAQEPCGDNNWKRQIQTPANQARTKYSTRMTESEAGPSLNPLQELAWGGGRMAVQDSFPKTMAHGCGMNLKMNPSKTQFAVFRAGNHLKSLPGPHRFGS